MWVGQVVNTADCCLLLHLPRLAGLKGGGDEGKGMRWSSAADEMLSRVPAKQRRQVVKEVEKVAKSDRGAEVRLLLTKLCRLKSMPCHR